MIIALSFHILYTMCEHNSTILESECRFVPQISSCAHPLLNSVPCASALHHFILVINCNPLNRSGPTCRVTPILVDPPSPSHNSLTLHFACIAFHMYKRSFSQSVFSTLACSMIIRNLQLKSSVQLLHLFTLSTAFQALHTLSHYF